MNIYCLTQFLRVKISKRLSWGGEGAVWFRVSCVAAIRLGLQLLKGSTVLENPISRAHSRVGERGQHFTVWKPPRAAHRMATGSPHGNDSKEESPRPRPQLSLQPSPRRTCPSLPPLVIGHTGYPESVWEDHPRVWTPGWESSLSAMWRVGSPFAFNKITLIPHTLIVCLPPVDYWPGYRITQHTGSSRYLRNFYQVHKCFSAFIKSMWELECTQSAWLTVMC